MRLFFLIPFALPAVMLPCAMLPGAALADTIAATSRITAVTVYPQGAEITRSVQFTADAGAHDLVITDLPAETAPEYLRLIPDSGLTAGAYSLRTDRLYPPGPQNSPQQDQAQAALDAAITARDQAQAGVDAIQAQIDAATAQADFLRGVDAKIDGTTTAESLAAIAAGIGSGVKTATDSALAARATLPVAETARDDAQLAVDQAQAALNALARPDDSYAALSVSLTVADGGEHNLTVVHYISSAYWSPVYDAALTRQPPALSLTRAALVTQDSGENWTGVDLTLSTAQPGRQSAPSTLWPDLRSIAPPMDDLARSADMAAPAPEMAAMAEAPVTVASTEMQGEVVVYHYPDPVDVAAGVEDLRLSLDTLAFAPKIEARAIPRYDQTAFLMATFTNTSDQILLSGPYSVIRDGTLIGTGTLPELAPAMQAELAFGAIDGLRLTYTVPDRGQGTGGLFTQSNRQQQVSELSVENLTDEAWPLHLLDATPYSEQDDLQITVTADPPADETDPDGQRGIWGWHFDLPAGETRKITLTHDLTWPEGQVLQ